MKFSLINKVAVGFSIALFLLFIEGVTFYRSITRNVEISKLIKHTNICVARLEEVLSLMKDMEIYSGGYVITGDDRFLVSLNTSTDAIKRGLNELKKVEANNPKQLSSIKTLESLIGAKIELQEKTIAMRRDNGIEAVKESIAADTGRVLMDGIQRVILDLKGEEYAELIEHTKLSNQAGRNAIYILVLGSIMALIVIGVAVFIINTDLQARLRAENARLEKETLLQNILETLPVGVSIISKDGKIETCNPAFNQIWYGVREVGIEQYGEYKGWWVSTEERIKPEEWAIARAITKGEISLNEEIKIESFDGAQKIILNSAVPIRNEKQEIIGAIAINQDISGRKKAELDLIREKEFSEFLIKSLPGIFFMFDMSGTLIRWNKSSEKITGYSHEETQQKKALEFIAPEDRIAVTEKIVAAFNSGESSVEAHIMAKDGRKILHHFTGVRMSVNGDTYILGVGTDVSERKEIEAANKKLIHELGERIKELTALQRTFLILQDTQKTIPDLLKEIVDILPLAWQYPDITAVRIRYADAEVMSPNFEESKWSQRADFTTAGGKNGFIEVVYLKEMPGEAEGPFMKEERTLINSLSEMIKSYLLRRQAEADLRDSRNLLQKVLESIPVGIWLIDKSGYIVYGNPEAQKIWGGSRYVSIENYDEYKGWRADTGKRIKADEWAGARAVIKGETTVDEEVRIECFDGIQKIIINSAIPIKNDKHEITGAIVVNQDITELRKAKADAEAASTAKSEFLANMSHEIRTPMNSIMGMADLLSETSLTEEQKKYVDIFRRAGENLLSLINDILDISKVEAGRIELEKTDFDLNETMEKVVEMLGLKAREKGLQLSYKISPDVPRFLKGDPLRMRQILVNLIGNSIKFTNEGKVALKVERQRVEGSEQDKDTVRLMFSVRDTGIGIPPDKLETIFESFSQAHISMARTYGGTGLGLTIAKRFVEMMGGKIWAESRVGEGSIFYFTANFGTSTMQKAKDVSSLNLIKMESQKRPLNILLVDDSEDNRMLIQAYLRTSPHRTDTAGNGREAVAIFKKGRYDLVFMDMQMPVMDGYTATREIRKWEKETGKNPTPIIALTAYALREDAEKSIEAGCTSHLSKPIKKADLLEAIDKYTTPEA